jgi:ppGpp synthetase/RelA/SpoT-type nucleotidyltranferase
MDHIPNFEDVISFYKNEHTQHLLKQFLAPVYAFFHENPTLTCEDFPVIHSLKSRLKNSEHLKDKLIRKADKDNIIITQETLFENITDLIGVRVLYLHQEQFYDIHNEILRKINVEKDWRFVEPPKAITWDPDSVEFYRLLGLEPEVRPTHYTSVHYIVKPNNDHNKICCEIQVRTLFEEIWGEIDHTINYPQKTDIIACKEQLRVLSKLIATGTRLVDSIFKCYTHHEVDS